MGACRGPLGDFLPIFFSLLEITDHVFCIIVFFFTFFLLTRAEDFRSEN